MSKQDHQFRVLFEKNPLAMWVFDVKAKRFLAANETAIRCYGYSLAEFLRMKVDDIRFPEDRPALQAAIERFLREDSVQAKKAGRWRHRRKDGDCLYAEVLWTRVFFGSQEAIQESVIDLSEQQSPRGSSDQPGYVGQPTIDVFWDWDLKADASWWSEEPRSEFSYKENQIEPHVNWWYQRIHPDDRTRVVQGLIDHLNSPKDFWEARYQYLRGDGTFSNVIDRGYVIRDRNGEPEKMIGTLMNISHRKRAEEQAELYADIFRNMQIGLHVHHLEDLNDDSTFRIVAANPASARISGLPIEEVIGRRLEECVPSLRKSGLIQMFAEVVRTGKEVEFENLVYGDERIPLRHYFARFFPLPNRCVGIAFEDISEKLKSEAKLRLVENRFQILASVLPVGIYQNDAEGNCVYANEKCCELCGAEVDQLLGKNWAVYLHPEDKRRITSKWQSCVRRQVPFHAEYRFRHKDRGTVWVLGQAVPEYDETGEFAGFIGSITDITERKRLENEILVISGQEQRRIGQALHDQIGQHLTGIAFLAKALSHKLGIQELPESSDAEEISRLINQAIHGTRDLARMLHPVEQEENGMIDAFQGLLANARRMFNITCLFNWDSEAVVCDNAVATHLYHIAQEAITNAVKHGHASSVSLELRTSGGRSVLKIEDNGVGIPADYQNSSGIGLRIMKHRATMIDGELQILPLPEGGTSLICTFLTPAHEPAEETV